MIQPQQGKVEQMHIKSKRGHWNALGGSDFIFPEYLEVLWAVLSSFLF
jgi:hypothetical protein